MGWVLNATPRSLYPREGPVTNCTGGWVGPRAGLDGYGKSRPHRVSIAGPSNPYRVATSTALSRPIYMMLRCTTIPWDLIEPHNKATITMTDDARLVFLRRPFGKRRDVLRIREDSWADDSREETPGTTIVLREEVQRLGENGLPMKKNILSTTARIPRDYCA